ncbi:hypothetical protein ACHWQZ_G017106 [Mnemiopsis leidyi]
MSGPESQQELYQLVKQEEELVKNILKCREKLKNLDVAEQNAGKVKVFDLSAERDGLALEIEDLKKRIGEKKQNHRKEEECEQTEPRVKLESTEDVCFDGTVSSRNVLFVQRDKGERYDDNGSMCKLKAPVYKLGDDFCTFLLRFEQYIMLSRVKDNLDFRLSSLIEDDAMFKKVRNIRLSAEERLDIGMLLEAVKRDMFPVTDTRILRTTFHKMRQGKGENVEQYAQRVMDEAEKIYPDRNEREGAAINVFISGVKDSEIKRKLFAGSVSEDFIGMTKLAIQEEHILEAIGMRSGSQVEPILNNIAPMFCVRKKDENQGVVNCQKCGKRGHVAASCWSEVVCQLCNRTGHVASVCWELATSIICQDDITASSSAQSEGVQPVVCFNCQEPGHIQRFCNRHQGGGNENQSSPSYDQQRTSQQDALKLANDWRNSGPIQSREIPEKRSEREKVADVNAVNWKHILVKGSCAGRDSYIFVDSGSAVSIVSTGFVKRLGLEKNIRKCRFTLKSFSQDIIQVRGEIDLELEVAGSKFNHTFIVTDLLDTEFLMGDDFLRRNWITLDYGQCRLLLPEGQGVSFTEKPENVEKQIKVRCSKVTVIPPNTVQYLKGKLQANGRSYQGVLEPQYKNGVGETGILFAKAVVHSDKKFVPVKCFNATDEPITIHKNKIVALLKPLGAHELIKGVQLATENECKVRGTGIDEPLPEQRPAAGDGRWTKLKLFESLGLDKIEVEMSDDEKERLKDIVWRYRNCFSYDEFDIGCCNMYEAEIKLKEGSLPSWTYPIPTPHKLQEEMDHQIDQMVKAGVAERLSEPSDFNHPIFLVKKKSSPGKPDSWRLVADLRGTNKVCMDEKYPLPNLNHVLDTIGSDTIFSSFDLSKSFWQVPYSEDSKKITAFMHRGRSYCWARLIMGHKNSSSIFSRVMAKLLATVPIEQLIFFIDDLFLSSRTVSSHLDRLEILLRRLLQANLKLTPKKCELLKKKVTFVGVSVSADGIQITEDRVKDLLDLPVPTTMKRVQEVLGALNYVRKWIPNYSELARPLHGLTVKGVKFLWTEGCQQAFDKLKRAIADSTILALPDTDDPCKSYHVTVDASKHGYGATLSQEIERNGTRERRIVAFFSKAVPPYKRERSQTQLEFDAMVLAIEHWKIYLSNTEFKVITDCKSLLSASDTLFSKSDPALIRKCQILANYNFSLEHVEGKRNTLCDFLSRFPFRRKLVDTGCQTVNSVRSQGEGTVRSRDISTSADLENDDRVVYTCKSETTANRNVNSNDNSPCLLQGGSDSMKTSFNRVVYTCDAEKIEHSHVNCPSPCVLQGDSNYKVTCSTRVVYTCDICKSHNENHVNCPSPCALHGDLNPKVTCSTRVVYTCDICNSHNEDHVNCPSPCDLHGDLNPKVTCPTRVLYTCDGAKTCTDAKVKHPSLCDLHSDSNSKETCPTRVLYTCDGAKTCSCIHDNVKHPSLCDLHGDSNSKVSCPTRVLYTCDGAKSCIDTKVKHPSLCDLHSDSNSKVTCPTRVIYTCDGAKSCIDTKVKHPSLCDLHSDSNSKVTCPTRVIYTCDGAKSCIDTKVKHPILCDLHSDSNSKVTCPTRVIYTCDGAKSCIDTKVKHPILCDLHSDSNSKVTCPTRVIYTCDGAKSCIDTKVKHPSLCDLHSDSNSKVTCPTRVIYTCDGAKSCIDTKVKHPILCDLHSDSNSKVTCPTRVIYTCDGAKSCIDTKVKHPILCDLHSDSNSKVTCPTRVIYTCDGAKSCIDTKVKHPSLCDLHSDSNSKVTCPTRVLYTCDCAKSHNEVNVKHCRPCHLQGDNSVNLTCPTRVLYTSDSFESCHKKFTYNKLCHPHSDYNSKMTCPTRVVYTCDSVLSDIEEQASEQSCERSSDTGDKERTGKIRKGTPSQVVDSAEEMDTDERSDLQILFEENHSGLVKVVQVEESDDSLCICGVAVMPRLRKKQGKRITFAVTSEESNSQNLPDLDRIKEEQEKDPIISVVKKWVTEGDRGKVQTNRVPRKLLTYWTQFNLLKLDDGLLKRKWIRKKEQDCKDLIVVPESCEEEIMKLFHDNITNCHPGINTCVTKCREYFYWPKMEEDFRMYIKACVRCGEMKQPRAYLKAPLKHLFFHHFNDAIVVDHIVPSANQRTPRGFRNILTITDAWSNYLVAVPVRSQTAKENIAAIMKYWVLKFGLCREIIVDNHPGFTAGFFEEVWKAFECKKTHGTSYKSASTARAENNNKRVNQALRACLPHGKEHCWDVYLDKVTFALNCLKNRRTGFSAHKMVFGREVNLPLNLVLDDSKPHVPDERNTAAREAYDLHKEMKRVIRKVRENSEIDFSYAQKQYDRNIHGPYFKKGDYCFVLIQCPTHKFAPRFRGPFEVKKVINDHLYVVEFGPGVEKVTNISKMKHYEVNRFSKRKVGVTQNVDDVVQEKVDLSERDDRGKSSSSDSSSDEEWYYPQQVINLSNGGNKTRMSRNVIDIDSPRASRSVPALQNDFEPVASPHTPSLVSQSRPESANSQLFPRSPGANYVRTPLDSSSGQNTRSFDSSVDFYTPRRDIRESEPTRNMEDSLSPVSLSGTSNVTMTQSPSDHSTPRMYGGRNLRNREQLRRPDYYQATHCIHSYNESEVGQDAWV